MAFSAGVPSEILHKYQGVASNRVINAVQKAAKATGVDFTFLMEKASTESSFDTNAKSKSSSATGHYQFIEDTWLGMVKRHGEKYGLGDLADKIEIKNGKATVDSAAAKKQILALRKDPEISACMAGEFCAENKDFLQDHTKGDVGSTELYLAHFMGAGAAAKFLNARAYDGDAVAAKIFPNAAHANKGVFYDKNGKARSLDDVYALFDKKFTGGQAAGSSTTPASTSTDDSSTKAPAASAAASRHHTHTAARALPVFDDANEADDIIWRDDPRFQHHGAGKKNAGSIYAQANASVSRLSAASIMAMSQMDETTMASTGFGHRKDRHGYNS